MLGKWLHTAFVLVTQSCPTLCYPMDCNLPGSLVHGISQARILEWVAVPSSRGSSPPRDRTWVSCTTGRHSTRLQRNIQYIEYPWPWAFQSQKSFLPSSLLTPETDSLGPQWDRCIPPPSIIYFHLKDQALYACTPAAPPDKKEAQVTASELCSQIPPSRLTEPQYQKETFCWNM